VARACLGEPRLLRRVLGASFAASVGVSFIGILMYFRVMDYHYIDWGVRIASLFDDPNNLGGYLAWSACAGLALFAGAQSRAVKIALGSGLAAVLVCLLMSSSRSAWAAAAVAMPAMLLLMRMRFAPAFKTLRPLFLILILLGGAFVAFTTMKATDSVRQQNIVERVKSYGAFLGTEGQERVLMHRGALRVAARHALIGVGPGNIRMYLPGAIAADLSPQDAHPHKIIYVPHAYNDYLTLAAETGAPGVLAFAAMFVAGLVLLWKRVRSAGQAQTGLLLLAPGAVVLECMLRGGLYQSIMLNPLEWFPLAVALGALCAAPEQGAELRNGEAPAPVWMRAALFATGAVLLAGAAWSHAPPLAASISFNTSLRALDRGHAAAALRAANRAYALAPRDEEIAAHLGYANFRNGRYEQAIVYYSRALDVQPQYTPAMQYLGNAHLALGDCDAAMHWYGRLMEFVPNYTPAMERTAYCLLQQNRCEPALPLYERLLRIAPDTAGYPLYAGICNMKLNGDIRRTLGLFHAAHKLDPRSADTLYNLGKATLQFGRPGEAEQWLLKALAANPDYFQAYAPLAHISSLRGDYAQAKTRLFDYLRIKGAPPQALQMLQHNEITRDNYQDVFDWAMAQ